MNIICRENYAFPLLCCKNKKNPTNPQIYQALFDTSFLSKQCSLLKRQTIRHERQAFTVRKLRFH